MLFLSDPKQLGRKSQQAVKWLEPSLGSNFMQDRQTGLNASFLWSTWTAIICLDSPAGSLYASIPPLHNRNMPKRIHPLALGQKGALQILKGKDRSISVETWVDIVFPSPSPIHTMVSLIHISIYMPAWTPSTSTSHDRHELGNPRSNLMLSQATKLGWVVPLQGFWQDFSP